MAKGPIITDSIRHLVVTVYLEHPGWRAKEIREEVNARLRQNNPKINPEWPSLSAVQKMLAPIHKKEREFPRDPKDNPWSVSDMVQYPIPPETLPVVLKAWAKVLEDSPLTIREVLWIARLYYVVKERETDIDIFLDKELNNDLSALIEGAKVYALHEIISQFLQKRPDNPEGMWGDWSKDAVLYKIMTGKGDIMHKVSKEVESRGQYVSLDAISEAKERTYRGGKP